LNNSIRARACKDKTISSCGISIKTEERRGYNRHAWLLESLNSENAINASPQFKPLVIHFYPQSNISAHTV